jgi:bifunctional enzyme CysN/CysC
MQFLRVIACGSVDDGKSTLIGRLLFESGRVYSDELAHLERDSREHGTRGAAVDYALLLDGLQAEREQGITIDVSWRHLQTPTRRFLIADCPGHSQYTRNMATGASLADLAIVLVDASKGLLPQSYVHSQIAALFGVANVLLAVNKMDKIGYDQAAFAAIASSYQQAATRMGITAVQAIPLAAAEGDNVFTQSVKMPWYTGPSVYAHLHQVQPLRARQSAAPFLMPVQLMQRDGAGQRWLFGSIAAGQLQVGNVVRIAPAGISATVAEMQPTNSALAVRLGTEVDVGRGAVLMAENQKLLHTDQLSAHLLWFDANALVVGRRYTLKLGASSVGARISEIKFKLDPSTGAELAAKKLETNDIAVVSIALDSPVVMAPYGQNQVLGSFILIDQQSFATLACGMVRFGLRRADNIHWQKLDVNKALRASAKAQQPRCIWFTGLSGAGKSTIANVLEGALHARGCHTYLLDGDNVRHGLNRDLGFTDVDRIENMRRVAEVAKLMTDAGLIVLVSFISPFRAERDAARALFEPGEFIEAFVDTPLAVAEARDVKGLYAKARSGQLPSFTGIDSPYEAPRNPELYLDTARGSAEALAEQVLAYLFGSVV